MTDGIAHIKSSRPKDGAGIPAEAGNVRLIVDEPDEDMTVMDAIGVLAILATSATGMLYGLVQLADKFFPNIFN